MNKLNLTKSKTSYSIDKIQLISKGLLSDESYKLDTLIEKLKPSTPIRVYKNLYTLTNKRG